VLALLQGPALFWLDAGYYGWIGMETDKQRLSAEMEMILSHPYRTSCCSTTPVV